MLAANIVAADFIEKNLDHGVYRVHETPESIKIDRLSQTLKRRGINWHGNNEDIQNLSNFLQKISSRKDASILNTLILQSMQRAEYKTKNKGHFGLRFDRYTHFTSPIRRYPDLLVHRMIISILNKDKINTESLEEVLEYCSQKERDAEFASKQVIQNLLCEYANNFRGKNFSGFVTGVKDFGLFVDIPDLFTSGLLHVNDLPDDFYRYNARNQTLDGRKRGNRFSLGDEIKVFIGDIKELEGKISLYY
jgi:Exoribonuclease R